MFLTQIQWSGNTMQAFTVVSHSSSMQNLLVLLKHLSDASGPVLFTGAKGTGKTFFAEYLHSLCSLKYADFLKVSANSLSVDFFSQLSEVSSLVVYISDIETLSVLMQEYLLGFLEQTSNTNVRIFTSTAADLEACVQNGVFSADLYGALSSMPVMVPVLKNRIEDIEDLSLIALKKYGKLLNKDFSGFTPAAKQELVTRTWTENVAGLYLAIKQACLIGVPPYIEKENLVLNNSLVSDIFLGEDKTLKTAIDQFKREYILKILHETRWNQTAAAKILGIQRTYLSRLIRELHIH